MFGTLFFDEAGTSATTATQQNDELSSRLSQQTYSRLGLGQANTAAAQSSLQLSAFGCRGHVSLPLLRATLQWWLDTEAGAVQLLVLNDEESSQAARTCQSRLVSVPLPLFAAAGSLSSLVTCGVTRNYTGDNAVAVVWVVRPQKADNSGSSAVSEALQSYTQPSLSAGFLQVTIQREVDNSGFSSLLVCPSHRAVECEPLSYIPSQSFASKNVEAGRGSACVVAELPEDATSRTASVVVLTDGRRLWRAELLSDGSVDVSQYRDAPVRNVLKTLCANSAGTALQKAAGQRTSSPLPQGGSDGTASESPASSGTSSTWLRRLLSGSANNDRADVTAMPQPSQPELAQLCIPDSVQQRLYAAISTVQQSPLVALTRWNGQVELYDTARGTLQLSGRYPIALLPDELLRSTANDSDATANRGEASQQCYYAVAAGRIVQWATRNASTCIVHVVTFLADAGEGRLCAWTSLPPQGNSPARAVEGKQVSVAPTGEVLAKNCTLSLTPPTLSSVPLACTITSDDRRLLVVSSIGAEEDAHLLCSRSLGALSVGVGHAEGSRGDAGVATMVQVMEAEGDWTSFGGLLRMSQLRSYLCQGARLQSVMAPNGAVIMVEEQQPRREFESTVPTPRCRLYTFEDAAAAHSVIRQAIEGVLVCVDEEDVYAADLVSGADSAVAASTSTEGESEVLHRSLHYVPVTEAASEALNVLTQPQQSWEAHIGNPFRLYWEGVSAVQSCIHGARLMTNVLRDVLQATIPIARTRSVPRFLTEAHLSGYTASLARNAPSTRAAAIAAIQLALQPTASPAKSAFYAYSRLYVTQAAMGDLLSRLTFLTAVYLGWQGTQSFTAAAHAAFPSSDNEDARNECGDDGQHSTVPLPSSEDVTQQLITALELLAAAYHAAPTAGADLVQVAVVEEHAAQATSASVVASLLPNIATTTRGDDAAVADPHAVPVTLRAWSVVQNINRLRRCGTPRTSRACRIWVQHLTHRFPILQHYELLSLLETTAAAAQSARVQACCERVCQALVAETPGDVVSLLLLEGFLLTDVPTGSGVGSTFRSLPLEEVAQFLTMAPAMAPKLYATGVLRRATAVGALRTSLSTTVTRRYLYTMLQQCVETVEKLQKRASRQQPDAPIAVPFQKLRAALEELQVDVLLASALALASDADMACCFHDVQAALDLITKHQCLPTYADLIQAILGVVVQVACASQASMDALLRVTTVRAAHLEESLIARWYNHIARMPTKSATEQAEAVRYRAIMGLHRYLMQHHNYAQCARHMSSLATLIRCSPLRRSASTGISVSELAGLALHAASLIAPSVPVAEAAGFAAGSGAATSWNASPTTATMAGSPLSLGYSWQPSSSTPFPHPVDPAQKVQEADDAAAPQQQTLDKGTNAPWLTRADIPRLQRRLYQAHCERQLWRRGCTLDCTDLWVEGVPHEAYQGSVSRLVTALMETRLWPQAFRFACLSQTYDPCLVLVEWAVDLLGETQQSLETGRTASAVYNDAHRADRAAAWQELIDYCSELSTLDNQFAGFVRTVTAALMTSFENVPQKLLVAHRTVDAYTAMSTLFNVALMLRDVADGTAAVHGRGLADEEAEADTDAQNGETSSSSTSEKGDGAAAAASYGAVRKATRATAWTVSPEMARRNAWLALSAAARIAVDLLQGNAARAPQTTPSNANAARRLFSAFTAGVLEPMVMCAAELLRTPAYASVLPAVPGAEAAVNAFLNGMSAPCV